MEKSSFFNAELVGEEYDRTYLAEDYAQYFASFIGNGVFPNPSNNLQVLADGTSMNVVLSMGKAWINGYFYTNTTDKTLVIAPADGVLDRIDRVVLRLDFLNREIRCYVKKGNFASTPIVPAIQRDADMYEIALADIKINKGAIAITQANITDLRQDSNYCGIVHGIVDQVDVTTLFNQYENALELKEQGFETEFTTWFESIKGQLSGDIATNLAGQITDINGKLGDMNQVPTTSKIVSGAITELFTNVSDGKNAISGAITDVDSNVVIPTNPTFGDLASAIGNISTGKKWASGSITSTSTGYGLKVNSLTFKPRYVIIIATMSNDVSSIAVYNDDVKYSGLSGWGYRFYTNQPESGYVARFNIATSVGSFEITGGPLDNNSGTKIYNWIAFE